MNNCDDAISRDMALEKMADYVASGYADSAEDFEEYSRIICQLPSVQPKPIECDDAISREKAIMMVCTAFNTTTSNPSEEVRTILHKCKEKLKKIESVQPSRKGHWIKVTNGRGGHECDLCHEYAPSYKDGDEYLTRYCPNCGADMRGAR